MVFLLGISLGVAALSLRRFTALVITGALIVIAFAAAALVSMSGVTLMSLLAALAGYNLGIATLFVAMVAMRVRRIA